MQASFEMLKDLGFTADQVVKIVSHGGGSKNIEAVQASFDALSDLKITADQVVKIASHDGGSKNIEAVKLSFEALTNYDFTADQVVKIASHDGGSKNIEAVKKHYQDLRAKGYTRKELVSMMTGNGGSKKIYSIIERDEAEEAVSNLLYFLNTVAMQSSENSPSQHSLNGQNFTSTFFSPLATNKRKQTPDDYADKEAEEDKHQDKRPNQSR